MSIQKRSQEEIENFFLAQGCCLLDQYTTAIAKMRYICSCGRHSLINWNKFSSGRRCGYCCPSGRKKKYTIEEASKLFEEKGCVLISSSYENKYASLKYRCVCGNETHISLDAFVNQGQTCIKCAAKARSGPKCWKWIADREQVALNAKFRRRIRGMLRAVLKRLGKPKKSKTEIILGYSARDLQDRISSCPGWDAVKTGVWHIDHIFPVKAFLDYGIHDLKIINCLENLSPLSGSDNCRKNATYNRTEFENWLISKGVSL